MLRGSCLCRGVRYEVRLRLGCLDSDPRTTPAAHIFLRSKAPWTVLSDDLPKHESIRPRAGAGPRGTR